MHGRHSLGLANAGADDVPVVIVATEESLASIPREWREGSLALGATKWETIWKIVLPGALPGILTGMILAMARGAGEVAPLMITGVVKLAPTLPLDGMRPFSISNANLCTLDFTFTTSGFNRPMWKRQNQWCSSRRYC